MKLGKCQLCLQVKNLVRAHIYPDFMYEASMFDEKHRMLILRQQELFETEKHKRVQTGFWDGNILCSECDNSLLSGYENYARLLMFGGTDSKLKPIIEIQKADEHFDLIRLHNVDYQKFKCFLISLIWRASITKLREFQNIDLGDKHNEKIREMLLTGDAGPDTQYEILMCSYRGNYPGLKDIVSSGISSRHQYGGRIISILIGGILYLYAIGSSEQKVNHLFRHTTPTTNNAFGIISFRTEKGMEICLKLAAII